MTHSLKNTAIALALLIALLVPAAAQTETPPPVWKALTDEQNITLAAYILANVADAGTDWNMTVRGQTYRVSAVRRCSFVGGTLGGALVISRYAPRYRKLVTAGLVVGSAILAGRAYGNTLTRASPAAPAQASGMVFALRLR